MGCFDSSNEEAFGKLWQATLQLATCRALVAWEVDGAPWVGALGVGPFVQQHRHDFEIIGHRCGHGRTKKNPSGVTEMRANAARTGVG